MAKRILALAFLGGLWATAGVAQEAERDPIKMKIIATNPSKEETQSVMIREPVPPGPLERKDIQVPRGLEVQFDSKTSLFYIVAEEREVDGKMERTIELAPGEADRTYVVELKDVWYVSDPDMSGLEEQANVAMNILEGSRYEEKARAIVEWMTQSFSDVRSFQTDGIIGRKEYMSGYLNSVEKLNRARAGIEELERYIKLRKEKTSEVMKTEEDMPLPSKTATWLVIFIILVFLGILTGAFYFVWQRRAHLLEGPLSEAQQAAFPESGPGSGEEERGA